MTQHPPRHTDRVEAYIEAVDRYEPTHVREHEDAFRLFARSMSRSLDARYLERHPTEELLPDLEHLMVCSLRRQPRETNVSITTNDDGTQRGVLTLCVKDYPFLISTIRLALDAFQVRSFRSLSCVMPIRRDTTGEISAVGTNDGVDELVMWIEIEAENLSAQQADLQSEIRHRLDDTCAAVHDFPAIREQVQQLADQFEPLGQPDSEEHTLHASNAECLRGLLDDHFIFLGTRFIPLEGVSADTWASLGVATVDERAAVHERLLAHGLGLGAVARALAARQHAVEERPHGGALGVVAAAPLPASGREGAFAPRVWVYMLLWSLGQPE